MKCQPIKEVTLFKGHKKNTDVPEPKYYCESCYKLRGCTCDTFHRHVEPTYNRCFYHSHYTPVIASFQVVANLDQIVAEEEKKKVG